MCIKKVVIIGKEKTEENIGNRVGTRMKSPNFDSNILYPTLCDCVRAFVVLYFDMRYFHLCVPPSHRTATILVVSYSLRRNMYSWTTDRPTDWPLLLSAQNMSIIKKIKN